MKDRIAINMAKCKKCLQVVISSNVHDYRICQCGAVAVDGGNDYLHRVGNLEDFDELSVILVDDKFILNKDLNEGKHK